MSLFASGSEVGIAAAAAVALEAMNVPTRVVSVPSFDLFARQDQKYRATVLGEATINVGIEAASRFGWSQLIGTDGIFVGMESFGASGKAEALYTHFGITSDAVVEKVMTRLAS